MDENIVDTGLTFKGHPILLGSRKNGRKCDELVLMSLERFIEKHFPVYADAVFFGRAFVESENREAEVKVRAKMDAAKDGDMVLMDWDEMKILDKISKENIERSKA